MTHNGAPAAQVLVIDDDADIGDVVQIVLEDAGYTVTVAPNGLPRSTCCSTPPACPT